MRNVLIHVGYPKCASSWLQKSVFVPSNGFCTPWPTHQNKVVEKFCWADSEPFDPVAIRTEFERCRSASSEGIATISHEVLVGDPIRRLFWGEVVAERLHHVFADAKVLVIFREQSTAAYSTWNEYVRRGGTLSLVDFLGSDDVPIAPGYRPWCPESFFRYDRLVSLYRRLFGAENVLALPMEALYKDRARFHEHVAYFAGATGLSVTEDGLVYPSLGPVATGYLRLLNHFRPMRPDGTDSRLMRDWIRPWLYRINRHYPKSAQAAVKRKHMDWITKRYADKFLAANHALQQMTPMDLSAYGYF